MSLFQEPFAEEVANQLDARQDLLNKEQRSPADLSYLNSKTAWVRLCSSVDIVSPKSTPSGLAMGNVLANGTLGVFGSMKKGVGSYATSAYSNQTFNASTKTNENNIMGIRPMAGITNVSIQNKGAYGSLRQASVTFQCWDIKQLDILEQLYMRPGYTLLLEWGWLPYIDNSGKLVSLQNQDSNFFNRKDIQLQDYLSDLRKRSLDSHGNYDAMFGYIMNYGWKYRADGGYDCTTEIISTGEILESYKINFSGAPVVSKDKANPTKLFSGVEYSDTTNIKTEYAKNVLTGIIYETYTACKTKFDSSGQTMGAGSFDYDYKNKKGVVSYAVSNVAVEIPGTITNEDGTEVIPTDTSESSGNVLDPGKDIYITLESFVGLINNFILLQNPSEKVNRPIMSLSINDRPESINKNKPLYCLTHPLQISVDPSVCIIRNDNFVTNINNIEINTSTTITEVSGSETKPKPIPFAQPNPTPTPIPTVQGQFGFASTIAKTELNKIKEDADKAAAVTSSEGYLKLCGMLNEFSAIVGGKFVGCQSEIYLNLRYLYNLASDSTLKSQDPAEKEGIQLIPFIKNILTSVQNATGNVNNFEVVIDGQSGYIVDLNQVNLKEEKPFTFNISGRNSILKDIQFESQIFSDQATIIAISAQSDAGKLGLENSSMVAFNGGIRDRMISKKDSPISSQTNPTEQLEGFVTALADIKIFFDAWNNLSDAKLKAEQVESFKTSLTEVIAFATTMYKSPSNKYKSILPTKVSLTFDGIGGIIIGNIFNIDKTFTPSSYKGDGSGIDLQYTVTNVSHTIGADNQWKTTIQGNPFIPDSASKNLDANRDLKDFSTVGFKIDISLVYDQVTGEVTKKIVGKAIANSRITTTEQTGLSYFAAELKKSGLPKTIQTAALAKAMTESRGTALVEEYKKWQGTSNDRIKAIFGSRVANIDIDKLKSNSESMMGFLYGPKSGTGLGNLSNADALKYIGRGHIGMTGRAVYAAVSKALYGKESVLLDNPQLLEKPEISAKASVAYLKLNMPGMAKQMKINYKNPTQDEANRLLVNTIGGSAPRNLDNPSSTFGALFADTTRYSRDPVLLSLVK